MEQLSWIQGCNGPMCMWKRYTLHGTPEVAMAEHLGTEERRGQLTSYHLGDTPDTVWTV